MFSRLLRHRCCCLHVLPHSHHITPTAIAEDVELMVNYPHKQRSRAPGSISFEVDNSPDQVCVRVCVCVCALAQHGCVCACAQLPCLLGAAGLLNC